MFRNSFLKNMEPIVKIMTVRIMNFGLGQKKLGCKFHSLKQELTFLKLIEQVKTQRSLLEANAGTKNKIF